MFPKHNSVTDKIDCYVSYNFGDRSVYGCDTTAIVIGQMQRFFILKGNHLNAMKDFTTFAECLAYYQSLPALQHPFSDKYNQDDANKVIYNYEVFKRTDSWEHEKKPAKILLTGKVAQ